MNIQQREVQIVPPGAPSRELHIVFKGVLVLLLVTGFILYRILLPRPNPACIYDAFQSATLTVNRQLVVDQGSAAFEGNSNALTLAGQAMIGAGQVLIDLWIAIFGIIWLARVKNVRGFGAFAGFFLIRAIIFLNVQKFPYPDNIVWRSPGFFSFTVPYDHTRDFFYSGHTGTLAIILLEMFILGLRLPAVMVLMSLLYMMSMLLITEVHYVVDIIGGLVFAIWFHRSATRAALWIDKALSLPFFVAKWIYENKCRQYCTEEKESTDEGEDEGERDAGKVRREGDFHAMQIESRKSLEAIKQ